MGSCTENRYEGELFVELRCSRRRICCICGSFGKYEDRLVFFVGTMQGARGDDAKEFVREATKDLHQLRPRDLVLTALQALVAEFGVTAIMAPTQTRHIYAGRRRPGRVKADFDQIWQDFGGLLGVHGDFELPLRTHYKEAGDIQPRKRAETLRRYALKHRIEQQIHDTLNASEGRLDRATLENGHQGGDH